ncbi:MAG: hypothetical protein KQJ78_14500 [Deltaproteobacteria bacterium]|nr:hypothetical protein [Deltaproteobacteria bacterium]
MENYNIKNKKNGQLEPQAKAGRFVVCSLAPLGCGNNKRVHPEKMATFSATKSDAATGFVVADAGFALTLSWDIFLDCASEKNTYAKKRKRPIRLIDAVKSAKSVRGASRPTLG